MKTILAPVDFSAASGEVIATAASLARAFGARIVLLTVIQPPVVAADYAPVLGDLMEITAAGEKAAAKKLAQLQNQLGQHRLVVEPVQLIGPPVPTIVAEAARVEADYIVMGSHGHTALYDLLVGSTTQGVLHRAKCPVVIVPATGKAARRRAERQLQATG